MFPDLGSSLKCMEIAYSIYARSDKANDAGLTLEKSALETLYGGGQFELSKQLVKPNYDEIFAH